VGEVTTFDSSHTPIHDSVERDQRAADAVVIEDDDEQAEGIEEPTEPTADEADV